MAPSILLRGQRLVRWRRVVRLRVEEVEGHGVDVGNAGRPGPCAPCTGRNRRGRRGRCRGSATTRGRRRRSTRRPTSPSGATTTGVSVTCCPGTASGGSATTAMTRASTTTDAGRKSALQASGGRALAATMTTSAARRIMRERLAPAHRTRKRLRRETGLRAIASAGVAVHHACHAFRCSLAPSRRLARPHRLSPQHGTRQRSAWRGRRRR